MAWLACSGFPRVPRVWSSAACTTICCYWLNRSPGKLAFAEVAVVYVLLKRTRCGVMNLAQRHGAANTVSSDGERQIRVGKNASLHRKSLLLEPWIPIGARFPSTATLNFCRCFCLAKPRSAAPTPPVSPATPATSTCCSRNRTRAAGPMLARSGSASARHSWERS